GGLRHGEILLDRAVPVVAEQAQRMAAAEVLVPDRAELVLAHALARVVLLGDGGDAARIRLELRARETERILRARQRQRVHQNGQLAAVPGRPAELGVAGLALGAAVVAVAVGAEMREVEVPVEAAAAPARVRGGAPGGVAAAGEP